ncbi:carbon-nitrogen hydrolase family protein [Rathayibacter toxicus]|uniref:carbon-nitrogen hydrolase family protein n=1 Tax=Rathayibacter toxicus TaxID=145458 RepID=UPI001C03B7DC|nr:carbon-nitrogen hydrolase family protein [Rathayibacter toxicus]QWL27321.1 carbon-nitrogen hydrolase family protein [Rathayibacter toxicus]
MTRLALAQIISTGDPASNLTLVRDGIADAAEQGAEIVVFPEATQCAFGNDLVAIAEPLDGPWACAVTATAREYGVTAVVGMFTPSETGRLRNTLLITGPNGVTSYDKIHLFDAFGSRESDTIDAGDTLSPRPLADTTIGFATCYDIRFPALFTAQAHHGATIIIVCASWRAGPGKADQWELLARARALDSTSFIIAVGQGDPRSLGIEPTTRAPTGIGRSLVISPLGTVLHRLGAAPELLLVQLDPAEATAARQALPVLANQRTELLPR